MNVLVIDVGGTHVKMLATGQNEPRKFTSGPQMTAKQMVASVKRATRGWKYDAVTIGFPGPVLHNRPVAEPHNLGKGWVGFDFAKAFGRPVKVLNDAAMQALGSYQGGRMLFLGFGTGLGSTLILDGVIEPMEISHLPYKKRTYEDYVGARALEKLGKKKWRKCVADVTARLIAALEPEDVVLGGGNVHALHELPEGCRAGDNMNAFAGGFRIWASSGAAMPAAAAAVVGPPATKRAARNTRARKSAAPKTSGRKTAASKAAPTRSTPGKRAART